MSLQDVIALCCAPPYGDTIASALLCRCRSRGSTSSATETPLVAGGAGADCMHITSLLLAGPQPQVLMAHANHLHLPLVTDYSGCMLYCAHCVLIACIVARRLPSSTSTSPICAGDWRRRRGLHAHHLTFIGPATAPGPFGPWNSLVSASGDG